MVAALGDESVGLVFDGCYCPDAMYRHPERLISRVSRRRTGGES